MRCQASNMHPTTYNLTKIHYLLRLDSGKPCLKVFAETQEWRLQVSCPEKNKTREQRTPKEISWMQTTSNIIKPLLILSLRSFHEVFMWNWCGFHCPCSATIVHTQWRLIRTFIHAWRSLRQRSCWHACHKMKMVKQDSINIYNRRSYWYLHSKTWLSTLNQRKLNKKDTRKVDFFRNKRKATSLWKKRLTVFAVLLQPSACLPKTHNANVKIVKHLSSMQSSYQNLIMRPSSTYTICRYPSAESRKKQHSTRFHCTASDMDSATTHNQDSWPWKSHTWGSLQRFCWHACHQAAVHGKSCMSVCNICHLFPRTTESLECN